MTAYSNNRASDRLLQLSDEVSRIAGTLARLSAGQVGPARGSEPGPEVDVPEVSKETVRSVIEARRLRSRYFSAELFADPAWDILLDLLLAEVSRQRVSVSSACMGAAVPATTALRWLKSLAQQGLIIRRSDPRDLRRVFVELTPEASLALHRYFAHLGAGTTI